MKIKIRDLKPNPFRDFSLYPIDPEQVERLKASMEDVGFFAGVTARKAAGGGYEMAVGHHRLEAAKALNDDQDSNGYIAEVDAVVEDYTDEQMVRIMVDENLLQRGYNASAIADSVAAFAKVIARDVLLGQGVSTKFLEDSQHPGTLARVQNSIAKDGPGAELIYRAINGFPKKERKNRETQRVKEAEIQSALAMLKASGKMSDIMQSVLAEVQEVHAERDRLAKQEAERKAKQEAEAEEKRRREIERAEEAERKAKAAAEEAKRRAEEKARGDAKRKAEAEAAAKKAQAEADKYRKEREKAEAKAREERKVRDEAAAAQREKDRAESERRAKERAAIEAQKKLDAVYDPAVVNLFRLPSHEKAFREFVLHPNIVKTVPRANQAALARKIIADAGPDAGAATITVLLNAEISRIWEIQKADKFKEQREHLKNSAIARVDKLWSNLSHGSSTIHAALEGLVDEYEKWDFDKSLFPLKTYQLDQAIIGLEQIKELKHRLLGETTELRLRRGANG